MTHSSRLRREAGFSLPELLVVLLLTVLIAGVGLALVASGTELGQGPPQAMDVQQRARAALMVLRSDLSMAGAGFDDGPLRGTLAASIATVLPKRFGLVAADALTVARPDAVTVLSVPEGVSAATLRTPLGGSMPTLVVDPLPNCPRSQGVCGITAGLSVLVVDETGRHGVYSVTDVVAGAAHLRALQAVSPAFSAGAVVVPIEAKTYYLDLSAHQLRVYDGDTSDSPVIDDVVDLRFDYFGDASPPTRPQPPVGQPNCLYDAAGAPRPGLQILPAAAFLSPLPLSLFTDGPWCGDGDRRFDADLLRVRAIRVTVRAQAGLDRFRFAAAFSLLGGTNRTPATLVPDLQLVANVTPRNLNFGR